MDDRATRSLDAEQIIYNLAKRNKELERRLKDEQQAHEESANTLKTARQQKLILSQQITALQKDKDALVSLPNEMIPGEDCSMPCIRFLDSFFPLVR